MFIFNVCNPLSIISTYKEFVVPDIRTWSNSCIHFLSAQVLIDWKVKGRGWSFVAARFKNKADIFLKDWGIREGRWNREKGGFVLSLVNSGGSCSVPEWRTIIHHTTISASPLKCNVLSLISKVMPDWCIMIANLMCSSVFSTSSPPFSAPDTRA